MRNWIITWLVTRAATVATATDHDFAFMMREHHRGAVDMARAELQNGRNPDLQKMARKIITDQVQEIRQLDRWLARHPAKPPQS